MIPRFRIEWMRRAVTDRGSEAGSCRSRRSLLLAFVGAVATSVHAQQFPAKPIRLILPFPTGSGLRDRAGALGRPARHVQARRRLGAALGRGRKPRARSGRESAAGRSHAARRLADPHDHADRPSGHEARPAARFHADHARRQHREPDGGPSFGAGEEHPRIHPRRARAAGQAHLRLVRTGLDQPPRHRALQHAGEGEARRTCLTSPRRSRCSTSCAATSTWSSAPRRASRSSSRRGGCA